jgi:magnesium-protoporphyrin O-methyltransferase
LVAKPTDTAQHKARLRDYFDGIGFERWSAIYGQGVLTGVRRSVREGHSAMLGHVQKWLASHDLPPGAHLLDAGCGTGLLSVALAQQGYTVTAADIAPSMAEATRQRAQEAGVSERMHIAASDLEQIEGTYDAVVCLDVLIHYPRPAFDQFVAHLSRLSRGPLILTYAPHNPALALMHHIGGIFPRSQRRTDIQMIPDRAVHQIIASVGRRVGRGTRVSCGFYHVALLEALPGA